MAKVTFNTDKCKGCGLCVVSCPRGILEISQDKLNKKGHPVAVCSNQDECIGCASCAIMCPDCVITVER